MKILIDTNILLDVLCRRQNFYEDSARIFRLCETKQIDGYISALSVMNLVYIMRKELDAEKIRTVLCELLFIFTIADLTGSDLIRGVNLPFSDYEDSVQSACARRLKADYIVTRDIRDFRNSPVPALMPADLLSRI